MGLSLSQPIISSIKQLRTSCMGEIPAPDDMFVDSILYTRGDAQKLCPKCGLEVTMPINDGINNYYCAFCGCAFHSCEKIKFELTGDIYCRWCQLDSGIVRGDSLIDDVRCPKCGMRSFHILSSGDSSYACTNPRCKHLWDSIYYSAIE